jgi:hypothetical protein
MEGHTAYIYMLSVYPFRMEIFSFSLYTKHTRLHGLMFFVKYGKGLGMQFRWANFSSYLYACASVPISWRTKFIHVQACDFITSGNRELLFRSHNAIDLRRGQQTRIRAFLGRQGTFINSERSGAGKGFKYSWFQAFMLRVIFWVLRRVVFDIRRFGTLCLFPNVGQVVIHSPTKMEQTQCSETSVKWISTRLWR